MKGNEDRGKKGKRQDKTGQGSKTHPHLVTSTRRVGHSWARWNKKDEYFIWFYPPLAGS